MAFWKGLFAGAKTNNMFSSTDEIYFKQYLRTASGDNVRCERALEVHDRMQFRCRVCGATYTYTIDFDNPTTIPHDGQDFVKFHRHAGDWQKDAEDAELKAKQMEMQAKATQTKKEEEQAKLDEYLKKYQADYEEKKKNLEKLVEMIAQNPNLAPPPLYVKPKETQTKVITAKPGDIIDVDYQDYVSMNGGFTAQQQAAQNAALQAQIIENKLKLDLLKYQMKDIPKIEHHTETPKPLPKAPKTSEGRKFR